MKMLLPVLAKRLLSFALALVLLLSLCPVLPLTADAAWVHEADIYRNLSIGFSSNDFDRIFVNNQEYDWVVNATQTINKSTVSIGIRGTITNENKQVVATCQFVKEMDYNTPVTLVSASDFSDLTTSITGTFQLKLEIFSSNGKTLYGTYTADEKFSRLISDPSQNNGYYNFVDGWTFLPFYETRFKGQFRSKHADLVFTDDDLYDWEVYLWQDMGSYTDIRINATIKNEQGETVGTPVETYADFADEEYVNIFSASQYPDLPTDEPGIYTLTLTASNGDTTYATLVKKFVLRITADPIKTEAYSLSKPNKVFSYADPIDLVLNIKKKDAVEEGFKAVTTITNANGEVVPSSEYDIPSSTNIDVSVKDLVNVTNIKTPGNYNVNVTLYNSASGQERYETTIPFAVVDINRKFSVYINGEDDYKDIVPSLSIDLQKDDGVKEDFRADVTVTNTETDSVVFTQRYTANIPYTIPVELGSLPVTGSFRMDVVVTDSEGITRGTASHSFTRTQAPITATMTGDIPNPEGKHPTGMIYTDADTPLGQLTIVHPSSANETLTLRYSGTYNGQELNETLDITMPNEGSITLNAKDLLKYGIYEKLVFEIFDSNGNKATLGPYTFSLVIDSSSASMPLLNINDHFTNAALNGNYRLKIPLAAQAGASMWRATIPWDTVEKVEGKYDFSSIDSVMKGTKQLGMQALIILAYNNDLYGQPNPNNSEWLNAYANYCYKTAEYMAEHYKDVVVGFEIWNEWNHKTMSKVPDGRREGDLYAKVVIAASEKIRQVNTEYQAKGKDVNFLVIGGATAGDGYESGSNTDEFLDEMLGVSGIMQAMDVFSFHTYPNPEISTQRGDPERYFEFVSPTKFEYANRITALKERLKKYGASNDLKIWMTETGWSTMGQQTMFNDDDGAYHITTGVTEQEQAAYMIQLYAWALTDGTLDRIFWYDLMNDMKKLPDTDYYDWYDYVKECNWGLIHNFNNKGDKPLPYSAKQGYVAMCAMSSMLSGATNGQSIGSLFGTDVHAYQFEKDGHILVVAWTDNDADTTRTVTFSGNMIITDMFGNATTYSGTATLELSECPIYMEYASNARPKLD